MSSSSVQPPMLTDGAVLQLTRTLQSNLSSYTSKMQPIMQVIHLSQFKTNNGDIAGRLKVVLSDGVHFISGMYAKPDLELLKHFCYVRVLDFKITTLSDGRIIILVASLEVIHPPIVGQGRIGNPIDIEKSDLLIGSINNSISKQQQQRLSAPQPLYKIANPIPALNQVNNKIADARNPLLSSEMNSSPIRSTVSANPYGNVNQRSHEPNQLNMASPITSNITPIAALNMYNNNWTIQGRVTTKSVIKKWSNANGDGSLFSIEILDAMDTNVRATFFKEAVDKFYNTIEVSKIYTFNAGKLKVANLQYNTCRSGYEITFDRHSNIRLMPDEGVISQQKYDFIEDISEIEMLEANKIIDLICVIKHVGECTKLASKKDGKELIKCDLILIDSSNIEIVYTLWGDDANKASSLYSNQPVVAIRRARLSEYGGGKSLGSYASGGGIDVNPMFLQNAVDLHSWWVSQGVTVTSPSRSLSVTGAGAIRNIDTIANRSDIVSIKELNMGYKNIDHGDYITVKGHLTAIIKKKEGGSGGGAWYDACPNPDDPCRNLYKVTQSLDGTYWECMKCGKRYPKPVRRWILRASLADASAMTWVSIFNTQAVTLLDGVTADTAFDMAYTNSDGDPYGGDYGYDCDVYDSIFEKAFCGEYYIKCRVKSAIDSETNENRINIAVVSISPIDYLKECTELLSFLESHQI